jgi:glycosyltransferase involved in cell wall biosynthesis
MLKAVENLEGVKLVVGGFGPAKELVEEKARHCPNIEYISWLPSYEDVLSRTCQADVLFRFSNPTHPNTKWESPNKVFEAMMCGKPIIVTDDSLMSVTVMREQCGLSIPYGDVAALRAVLSRMKEDRQLCRKLGENGRKAYEAKYSWNIMKDRLLMTYHDLETM